MLGSIAKSGNVFCGFLFKARKEKYSELDLEKCIDFAKEDKY